MISEEAGSDLDQSSLTLHICDRREVEVNSDSRFRSIRFGTEEDEFSTRIHRNSDDTLDSNRFTEIIILPTESFVESVSNVIGRVFIVCENENRSLISVFPNMGILVNFFPGESSISSEESVGIGVGEEMFSDVSNCQHQTDC